MVIDHVFCMKLSCCSGSVRPKTKVSSESNAVKTGVTVDYHHNHMVILRPLDGRDRLLRQRPSICFLCIMNSGDGVSPGLSFGSQEIPEYANILFRAS